MLWAEIIYIISALGLLKKGGGEGGGGGGGGREHGITLFNLYERLHRVICCMLELPAGDNKTDHHWPVALGFRGLRYFLHGFAYQKNAKETKVLFDSPERTCSVFVTIWFSECESVIVLNYFKAFATQ